MKEEFNSCPHIELTSTKPEWNPHNGAYSKGEAIMTRDDGNILPHESKYTNKRDHGCMDFREHGTIR
jgi:hypothetical protein